MGFFFDHKHCSSLGNSAKGWNETNMNNYMENRFFNRFD